MYYFFQSACLLLRVDDIVSGVSKKKSGGASAPAPDGEGADIDERAAQVRMLL